MPNIQAAKKALRQNVKRRARNLARQQALKDAIKKVQRAMSKGEALKLVVLAQKALDKAAKAGIIKKNAAARKLSRLMQKAHTLAG